MNACEVIQTNVMAVLFGLFGVRFENPTRNTRTNQMFQFERKLFLNTVYFVIKTIIFPRNRQTRRISIVYRMGIRRVQYYRNHISFQKKKNERCSHRGRYAARPVFGVGSELRENHRGHSYGLGNKSFCRHIRNPQNRAFWRQFYQGKMNEKLISVQWTSEWRTSVRLSNVSSFFRTTRRTVRVLVFGVFPWVLRFGSTSRFVTS